MGQPDYILGQFG